MKVLILAGGFAKRLHPLTSDKAKPLLPVAGKPVISHIVENVPEGIPIIVSTNATFGPDFLAWKETHPERDITVFVEPTVSEQTKKGALGAVGLAINEFGIDEDLVVIGGDNFFTFSLAEFVAAAKGQPLMAVFDIQDLEAAKKFGVVVCDGHRIAQFQEKPENPASTLVVGACFWIPARHLSDVREAADLMPDKLGGMFEHFLNKGIESHVYSFTGYWNDIGSFRAYVEAHVQAGVNKISVPEKFLDPALGNTFEGVNHIDPTAEIRGSYVKDAIVLARAHIENSRVETCVIDHDAHVHDADVAEQILK